MAVLGLADREHAFDCLVDHYAEARAPGLRVPRQLAGADRFGVIEIDANAS